MDDVVITAVFDGVAYLVCTENASGVGLVLGEQQSWSLRMTLNPAQFFDQGVELGGRDSSSRRPPQPRA